MRLVATAADCLVLLLARCVVRCMSDRKLAEVKGRLASLSPVVAPSRDLRFARQMTAVFAGEISRRARR